MLLDFFQHSYNIRLPLLLNFRTFLVFNMLAHFAPYVKFLGWVSQYLRIRGCQFS